MPQLRIVALGSSFAAGPFTAPVIGLHSSGPSDKNSYAHLLAEKLDAEVKDLSRSGATLPQILNKELLLVESRSQWKVWPADADIVTLTAGGNDMNYVGGMMIDAIKATLNDIPVTGELFAPSAPDAEEIVGEDEVTNRFLSVIDRIKVLAPKATVYLVEYQTVLGPDAVQGPENPLNAEQIAHHRRVAEGLQRAYAQAAEKRPDVRLVHVAEPSSAHGVGSAEPWVLGFTPDMLVRRDVPFHPNAAGHRAVADLLYDSIQKAQQ